MSLIANGVKFGITAGVPALLYLYSEKYSTGIFSTNGFVYLGTLTLAALLWAVASARNLGLHRFTALHSMLPMAAYFGPSLAGLIAAALYFAGMILLLTKGYKEENFARKIREPD